MIPGERVTRDRTSTGDLRRIDQLWRSSRPDALEIIESMVSQYVRYFTWRMEDGGGITTRGRNNAIFAAENRMGKLLRVYVGD